MKFNQEEFEEKELKDEEVLFKTNAFSSKLTILLETTIIIMIGIFIIMQGINPPIWSSAPIEIRLFVIILGIFILTVPIWFTDPKLRTSNAVYYFTQNKLIQISGRGLYSNKPIIKEVYYSEISYFYLEFPNSINIFKNPNDGKLYWKHNLYRDPDLYIALEKKECQDISKDIIEILNKTIAAISHPEKENLYINKIEFLNESKKKSDDS